MKKIWLWYLYDFANSFASIVLLFYYPLVLSEKGASDSWIGISASVSTGILLLILPYLGRLSDKVGKKIYFIRIGSLLMVLSLVLISFIIKSYDSLSIYILIGLSTLYIIFQVCFQGSYSFYSAMLRDITNINNNIKVSGLGFGFGQLGNVAAILIIGLLINTKITVFGLNDKSLALFLGGMLFLLISLPFFNQKDSVANQTITHERFTYTNFVKKISHNKRVLLFLIGYSLLADALLTFQLYVALYVKAVFGFSDQFVMYAAVTGLVFSIIGGFISHEFVKKVQNKSGALKISSILYGISFGLTAIIPPINSLVFVTLALGGISFGLVFSLARSIYSEISPLESQSEFFSIYSVFEKAASVIGPLVWISTFFLLKNFGENIQYRGSLLLLMFICFAGLYFVKRSESFEVAVS